MRVGIGKSSGTYNLKVGAPAHSTQQKFQVFEPYPTLPMYFTLFSKSDSLAYLQNHTPKFENWITPQQDLSPKPFTNHFPKSQSKPIKILSYYTKYTKN